MKEAELLGKLLPTHPGFAHLTRNQGEVSNSPIRKVTVTFAKHPVAKRREQVTVTSILPNKRNYFPLNPRPKPRYLNPISLIMAGS